MRKSDLLRAWQEETQKEIPGGINLKVHATLLETLSAVITRGLVCNDEVPLPGLGKFTVKETAARKGRNPGTGEAIEIPAGRKVVFKASKVVKDRLAR